MLKFTSLALLATFAQSQCTEAAISRCRMRMSTECATKYSADTSVCIAPCASDVKPQWVNEDCCLTCVPGVESCTDTPLLGTAPTPATREDGTEYMDYSSTCKVRKCVDGEMPQVDPKKPCCATCIPFKAATTCTLEQLKMCATKDIPECTGDDVPKKGTDCCRTCREPRVVCTRTAEQWLKVPACEEGEPARIMDDGCPSCVTKQREEPTCTQETITQCPAVEVCADGVFPQRAPDQPCCRTCKAQTDFCTMTKIEACRTNYESLDVCADLEAFNSKANFDTTTCCKKCKAPKKTDEAPDGDGRCTEEAFRKCLSTKPVCASADEYFVDKEACCGTCQRPERQVSLDQAAKCLAARSDCRDGEKPVSLDGEFCSSCRRTTCSRTTPCDDGFVCYKDKCISKKGIRIRIKTLLSEVRDKLIELKDNEEELTQLVRESLNRYCENQDADRQAACKRILAARATCAVKALSTKWDAAKETLSFELDLAEASKGSARRLLQAVEGDIVTNALNDPDAGFAGATVELDYDNLDSASTALPSFAAMAVAYTLFQ